MANNIESVKKQVFQLMKGFGYTVSAFTAEGDTAADDPYSANRFYDNKNKIMVNVNTTEEKAEIEVGTSDSTNISDIKDFLNRVRTIARDNMLEYTLRTYGTDISPKDFAYKARRNAQMKVQEGISKAYGSTKSSYQTLENAKLIIKHKRAVDEEVRGSRSRNIHSIFIENATGERYKFPYNNLSAARSMLRHVKEGGTPYDAIGEHIISLSEEVGQLNKFRSYVRKNSLVSEDTSDVVEGVNTRLSNIKQQFSTLSSTKGYKQFSESFNSKTSQLDEEEIDNIRTQFTKQVFDEEVASALPHVARIVKEMNMKKRGAALVADLQNKVDNGAALVLTQKLDPEDPDNPSNMKFANPMGQVAAWMGYLGQHLQPDGSRKEGGDDVSNLLLQLSSILYDLAQEDQIKAIKLLTTIKKNAKLKESEVESVAGIQDNTFSSLEESFSQFDPERFLA